MDRFNYLLVIVGIVLGLGITHLLSGFVDYVHNRRRLRWSGLQLLWMMILFLMQVQYWYTMFQVRNLGEDFSRYLASLLFPTLLYIASGVLVPKLPESQTVDLRESYRDNQRWFFGICALGMVVLVVHSQLVYGRSWVDLHEHLTEGVNLFRLIGLGFLIVLMIVRGWLHLLLSLAALAALGVFIANQMLNLSLFG